MHEKITRILTTQGCDRCPVKGLLPAFTELTKWGEKYIAEDSV